jgi:hypothetical protein
MSQIRFETWHLDLQNQIGKLHFDIRHPNTLPWKAPKDLSANLAKLWRLLVRARTLPPQRECRTSLVEARGYYCVASKGLRGE